MAELNAQAEDPTLWNDTARAQRVMREPPALDDQLNAIGRIERDLDDQITMIELGEAEKDQAVVTEAEAVLRALKAEAARRELEALLSGEADANEAYLEVHAGAGGTESQDWAGILLRMYTRWAEQHGYKVDFLEDAWRAAPDEERDFFQGLVHFTVAWYQAGRGNRVGCERQLEKCARRPGD